MRGYSTHSALILVTGGLLTAAAHGQTVLYVDAARATGLHNGTNWSNAYRDLQDALSSAAANSQVSEIRVAGGTYKPDRGTGDAARSFVLRSGLALRGGFAGSQSSNPDLRDPESYPTVLSGDLAGNDATAGNAENTWHVVDASNVDATAVLDGMTVRGGFADGVAPHNSGGGMRNLKGRPTVLRCRFEDNEAVADGGAVHNISSTATPTFTDCTFESNTAGNRGGAMFNDGAGNATGLVTLNNSLFQGNTAATGGAVYSLGGRSGMFGCVLEANTASAEGGAVYNFTHQAAYQDCVFDGNHAVDGGGVYNSSSSPALTRCYFEANTAGDDGAALFNQNLGPSLANCAFVDNSAGDEGGALWSFNVGTFQVRHCTFSGNLAGDKGGGLYNWGTTGGGSSPQLSHCVLWANQDMGGQDESAQMQTDRGAPTLNYSCLHGLTGGLGGTGNIGQDPLLASDGWRLQTGSPCVDAGDPNFAGAPGETDLDGGPRVFNGRVDMGAHEYIPPDVDADGVEDQADNCPGTPNPNQEDADGDGPGDACDACPHDADDDVDGDAVCGDVDNCLVQANPGQQDADGDGAGDACDPCPNDAANDTDGDGRCADEDNCPTTANSDQQDMDGDGTGDACDPCPSDAANDADDDGVCGEADNCPNAPNHGQQDADGDGTGDACDDDDDNDGLSDAAEAQWGTNPLLPDTDGDGLTDGAEAAMGADTGCPSPLLADSDGDSLSDSGELSRGTNPCNADSDGDGLPDNLDPTPTRPRVTPADVTPLAEDLFRSAIPNLELSWFNGPNANANKGRRTALMNRAKAAAGAIRQGDYDSAQEELESLLDKVDARPTPPDWVYDRPETRALAARVRELLSLLNSL